MISPSPNVLHLWLECTSPNLSIGYPGGTWEICHENFEWCTELRVLRTCAEIGSLRTDHRRLRTSNFDLPNLRDNRAYGLSASCVRGGIARLEAALLVLWGLRLQATALGAKDVEVAAAQAHDVLTDCKPLRDER